MTAVGRQTPNSTLHLSTEYKQNRLLAGQTELVNISAVNDEHKQNTNYETSGKHQYFTP